ncbi:recombinase family protein [Mycolicibacterium aichiense]|uniref:recombinase family protein n=1 Tax=Mycolicibacterium aichiense TaxID=1799 RepID=UPI003D66BCFE
MGDTGNTVLYLRESIDDEQGLARHRQDCLDLCARNGWNVSTQYVDNDESASPEKRKGKARPAYARMLSDIEAGKVNRIVCWHADRLCRHPRELEDIIDICRAHKVALNTFTGELDLSNDMGRTVARILGAVARGEVERKSARQKAAAKQHADGGRAWWPSRPFGYDADPDAETGKWWTVKGRHPHATYNEIRLHPTEAKLLRDAYRDVVKGSSLHSITAAWNAAGVVTPRGHQWRGAQLRQVLLAPRNAALRSYAEDDELRPAAWPAIVTRDQWEAVCGILADPQRRSGVTRGRKYLLSGIAICGACTHTLGSGITTTTKLPNYQCKHCHKVSRNAKKTDGLVIETVVGRLSEDDAVELVIDTTREDVAELQAQADALRAKIKAADDEYIDGIIDGRLLAARKEKLNAELTPIKVQLEDADRAEIFDGVIGADDVDLAFRELPLDRKRRIISALVTVTVNPTGRGRRFHDEDVDVQFRQ